MRKTFLKNIILAFLVRIHNSSYHWISFFSFNKGLHPKHEIQNYHQFFLDNISNSDSVLDIGSGNGVVAFHIASKAKKVIGIDIRPKNITLSQKKYSKINLKFINGDATTFDFQEKFDVIVLSNVLEHIEDRINFLKKIKKLAPKILIRVPLITRDWISVWKKNNGFNYKLDNTHFIEYTEEYFQKEIEKSELKISSFYVKFGELYSVVLSNN